MISPFINNVINKLSSEGLLKDCEIVEITIAETEDLEQDIKLDNSFWKQECDSLQKALADKDKEIEELKAYKKGAYEKYVSKCAYLQQQIKDIRKQVCDEVRKVIDYHSEWYEQGYVIDMTEEDLLKEIDKIEQAEGM